MQIDFYCPRWGFEDISWPVFAQQVKNDGFAGVEVFPLGDKWKNTDMLRSLSDNGLSYILLHTELKEGKDFNRYVRALEGPQVTDPRAPENREALQHHLAWWDQWITHLMQTGCKRASITPEFGPYPYMAYRLYTTQPIAGQYEINRWMKEFLETRYVHGADVTADL